MLWKRPLLNPMHAASISVGRFSFCVYLSVRCWQKHMRVSRQSHTLVTRPIRIICMQAPPTSRSGTALLIPHGKVSLPACGSTGTSRRRSTPSRRRSTTQQTGCRVASGAPKATTATSRLPCRCEPFCGHGLVVCPDVLLCSMCNFIFAASARSHEKHARVSGILVTLLHMHVRGASRIVRKLHKLTTTYLCKFRLPSSTRRAPASVTAAPMTPGCSSTTGWSWTWEASGSSPAPRGWTTWASRTARRT